MAEILNAERNSDQLCKLLVVEDNPGDVRLLREALREASFPVEIYVAGDGQQALDVLDTRKTEEITGHPDMILLDLNLPLKSGHEVLSELKSNPMTKQIPVIIFSTSGALDDIFQSYQNHANCYISKPSDLDEYMAVTRTMFDFWLRQVTIPGTTRAPYG